MTEELLTALASYCNDSKCRWASLNEDANKQAKELFSRWLQDNVWNSPWDGFIAIAKQHFPTTSKVTKFYEEENVIILFPWYGDTWAICS